MATISGYNSYSMGVLFSGLNTTSSKNSLFSNSMSGSDILGINYSDWATIRSGSYLLNAYYGKGGQVSDSDDTTSSSTSTSKDSTRTLAVIESDAKSVEKSVAALQETGDKSLFNEVTKTDENGNKTTGYDTDAIYKAVKNFTDSYNSLIDEVGNSNTKSILRAGASMVNVTEANRKSLSDIGISIGADNKLTIDEEKFKKTDMSKVKAMFADSSYYGTEVKRQAGRAESYAKRPQRRIPIRNQVLIPIITEQANFITLRSDRRAAEKYAAVFIHFESGQQRSYWYDVIRTVEGLYHAIIYEKLGLGFS